MNGSRATEVIDLDELRSRQSHYSAFPDVLAAVTGLVAQIGYLLFPVLVLFSAAMLHFGKDGLDPSVLTLLFLFSWGLMISIIGVTAATAFETFSWRSLCLSLGFLAVAQITGLALVNPSPAALLVTSFLAILLGCALLLSFDRMIQAIGADPAGRLLLAGHQRARASQLSRLSLARWSTILLVLSTSLRLLALTVLGFAVSAGYVAVSMLAPPFGILAALVALFLFRPLITTLFAATIARFRARSAKNAAQLYQSDPRRPILFLRSFRDDGLRVPHSRTAWQKVWGLRRREMFLEEALAETAFRFGPVGAVQDPNARMRRLGAARHLVTSGSWQDYVAAQVSAAGSIILITNQTPGIRWEWQHIQDTDSADKNILVFPPDSMSEPPGTIGTPGREEFATEDLRGKSPVCCFRAPGRAVLVVSSTLDARAYSDALLLALTRQHEASK